MVNIDYRYEKIAGLSADSFFTIGVRHDEEHDHHDHRESWCVHIAGDRITTSNGYPSWFTGIFRAPEGPVFISDAGGVVFRNPRPADDVDAWSMDAVDASLVGVWGLRADFVIAWGGPDEKMFRWDGHRWNVMPHPGGWVRSLHGLAQGSIYAVGHAGLVAHWDGARWTRVPDAGTALNCVFAESNDHVFAGGPGGELFEGSKDGMSKLLTHDHPISAVAWWRDALWVGAGSGLHKLVDGKLALVKDTFFPDSFDARGDLLIGSPSHAVYSRDGRSFIGHALSGFAKLRAGYAALWAPRSVIDDDAGWR